MEYYSALKKNEILSHAITWMNLEDIMLSEISQSQKNKYYVISLIGGIKSSQIQKQKKTWIWGFGKTEGTFQDGRYIENKEGKKRNLFWNRSE